MLMYMFLQDNHVDSSVRALQTFFFFHALYMECFFLSIFFVCTYCLMSFNEKKKNGLIRLFRNCDIWIKNESFSLNITNICVLWAQIFEHFFKMPTPSRKISAALYSEMCSVYIKLNYSLCNLIITGIVSFLLLLIAQPKRPSMAKNDVGSCLQCILFPCIHTHLCTMITGLLPLQ